VREYCVEGPWKGTLVIVPRPRGGDWLQDEISHWRDAGIKTVVSFLTPDEIASFELEAEKRLCEDHGIRFVSFPIPDRGVPESAAAAGNLLNDLKRSLVKGDKVALHCRQSVGRSALIAACLLVRVGKEPGVAFEQIGSARGGTVPDTIQQEQWVADREKDMPTKGERLFEAYLLSQGITDYEFDKSHLGKAKRPDYSVALDREYLFEVKDFTPVDIPTSGAYDPHRRIRQKIDLAREQFREYKDLPCSLVLYNNNSALIHLESPHIMLGAMYGDWGVSIDFNPELGELDPATERTEFHGRGKMIRPNWSEPQNTTISAVITLREFEVGPRKLGVFLERVKRRNPNITPAEAFAECFSQNIDFDKHERQLGVIVWENGFARVPLPRNLFCGTFDERWGRKGEAIDRVFVGSGITALEEIEKSALL
jgi:protein-tyrosine phosphatase